MPTTVTVVAATAATVAASSAVTSSNAARMTSFNQCLEDAGIAHNTPKYVTQEQRPDYDVCKGKYNPSFDTTTALSGILLVFFLMVLLGYGVILIGRKTPKEREHDRHR